MNNKELNFVLEYLVNEGYTESYESASKILNVMTEDWLNSILEEVSDDYLRRSAAASDAALQAAKAEKLKAQREQSTNAPIHRHIETGERVVTDAKGNFYIGRQRIDPSKVKTT